MAGFVLSSGVVLLSESAHWVLWVSFVGALFAAALGDRLRPELGAAAFTVVLVSLYTLVEPAGLRTGEMRLANVSIGAAITLGVTLVLWPRPGRAPRRLMAEIVERARVGLSGALAGTPPPQPLAVVGDLDRVLDVVSTSAPRALADDERARILVTVDLSASLTDLLADPAPAAAIARAAAAPRVHAAVATDGARADGALAGLVARLAHAPRPAPPPPPDALPTALTAVLARGDDVDDILVSGALRTAAAFGLVHRLASDQPPTATGTLE
jgi:uncharacterized membrane protein YccC